MKLNLFKIKVMLSCLGIFALIWLCFLWVPKFTQPDEENSIKTEMAKVQMHGLYALENTDIFQGEYVTWNDLEIIEKNLQVDKSVKKGIVRKDCRVHKNDWYEYYKKILKKLGTEVTQIKEISFVANEKQAVSEDAVLLNASQVLTDEGVFFDEFRLIEKYQGKKIEAVVFDNRIIGDIAVIENNVNLENVCVLEVNTDSLVFFWNHYEITLPVKEEITDTGIRNFIADIAVKEDGVTITKHKTEKINGKVLKITPDIVEIEGYGELEYTEETNVYRLVGQMKEMEMKDVSLGYDFCDFVVEKGKIVAGLMMKEEDMDSIRVLLQNSGYQGYYHETVSVKPDCEYEIIVQTGGKESAREKKQANEAVTFSAKDLKEEERIIISPMVLSGKIKVDSIDRAMGKPVYSGRLEITREDNGLLLINELLLEEYLYSVVPSEMPASYLHEALKAQAVSARTYAYGKMQTAGLPAYGAHVDDSTAYQVYHNVEEQLSTTKAIKETKGQIVTYNGLPVQTYYYSTSCGTGTDIRIWNPSTEAQVPYLVGKKIGTDAMATTDWANSLCEEEKFKEYILSINKNDYEAQEAWYRWRYTVNDLNVSKLEENLAARFEANPTKILTLNSKGEYESKEIEKLGKLKSLTVTERLPGGVINELVITGSKSTVKVVGELNVRYALCDNTTQVERHMGDFVAMPNMLPSAYFIIEEMKDDNVTVGYTLYGGGFGHGVGLSQNGAQNMAKQGILAEDILLFFYEGCKVDVLYGNVE